MNILNFKLFKTLFFYQLLFFLLLAVFPINAATISSEFKSGNSRIAPGEFLPVSVKLVNFGSQKRIDVIVNYKILDANNKEIYLESETVAVETTASFIKRIQLPYTIKHGLYTLVSSLNYPYQKQPAVSKFPFLVEEKIGGFFKSDLILYSIAFVLVILIAIVLTYLLAGVGRKRRVIFHDYSDKSKEQMIYYEMLSDIISEMRLRIGDDALEIAKNIPDLEINGKNGLIINIKNEPAKIIALLISRYEKLLGKKISFGLRPKRR